MEKTITKVSRILKICAKFLFIGIAVLTLTSFKPLDPEPSRKNQNAKVKVRNAFTADKTPK